MSQEVSSIQIRFTTELVTPDQAARWLAGKRHNRSISPSTVACYAADMSAGRWQLTTEAISFDEDGRLDNGQHRLSAVVASGVPTWFTIAVDAPTSQFEVIDSGRKRSVGDTLSMDGLANAKYVASAARLVVRYDRWPSMVWGSRETTPTPTEVLEYSRTSGISQAGLHEIRKMRLFTGAIWLAAQHIIERDAPSAERLPDFRLGLIDGIGLSDGDARLALRGYGVSTSKKVRWGNGQSDMIAIIYGWNHWLSGKETRQIKAFRGMLPMPKPY